MKQSIAKRWVKALRSGKYKQGRGKLRRVEDEVTKHCCLGVLCELRGVRFDGARGGLNREELKWGGFESKASLITAPDVLWGQPQTLAELNDAGWSFERIATYIEKNWMKL